MLNRLRRRWSTIRSFAATGQSWRDRCALAVAGFARHRPFGDDSFYARVGRTLFRSVTPKIAPAAGLRLRLDLTDLVDPILYEEIFVDGVYPLERVPFVPDLVIDCGACHGMFTLLARARFPASRLIAFEPEPANFARLQTNLSLNAHGIEAVQAAVGAQDGRLHFCGDGFGGHLLASGDDSGIEVEVRSLPGMLRSLQSQRLVLKIDIEGAERELLPALAGSLPLQTVIFLETHHNESACAVYLQPCLDAGFHHEIIRRRVPGPGDAGDYVEHLLIRHEPAAIP